MDKCCGSCMYFHDEDINGHGNCSQFFSYSHCNDICSFWVHKQEEKEVENDK